MSVDNSQVAGIVNISAYRFVDLPEVHAQALRLRAAAEAASLKGTLLLSTEGVNLNLAGTRDNIDAFCAVMTSDAAFCGLRFKESYSDFVPFRRLIVKIKPEIITFKDEDICPRQEAVPYIAPQTLKVWLDEGRPVILLDTRNAFELSYGAFRGAVQFDLSRFSEWSDAVQAHLSMLDRRLPIVTYCTGGVRCEKAGIILERLGSTEVYQLEGGILAYFEACGGAHYEGECFVFDARIALDSQLQVTR